MNEIGKNEKNTGTLGDKSLKKFRREKRLGFCWRKKK